jgi:hypothetical protein
MPRNLALLRSGRIRFASLEAKAEETESINVTKNATQAANPERKLVNRGDMIPDDITDLG